MALIILVCGGCTPENSYKCKKNVQKRRALNVHWKWWIKSRKGHGWVKMVGWVRKTEHTSHWPCMAGSVVAADGTMVLNTLKYWWYEKTWMMKLCITGVTCILYGQLSTYQNLNTYGGQSWLSIYIKGRANCSAYEIKKLRITWVFEFSHHLLF